MSNVNGNGNGRGFGRGDLATWAGVILTLVFGIGGAIGAAIGFALQDTRNSLADVRERELTIAFERGQLTERIDNQGTALVHLDETLQREMRLLDAAMEARLIDLDHRLQGEIGRASAVGAEDRANLRRLLEDMQAQAEQAIGQNASTNSRLDALERDQYQDKP